MIASQAIVTTKLQAESV